MATDDTRTTEELHRELIERQLAEQRRKDTEHEAEHFEAVRTRAKRETERLDRTYGTRQR